MHGGHDLKEELSAKELGRTVSGNLKLTGWKTLTGQAQFMTVTWLNSHYITSLLEEKNANLKSACCAKEVIVLSNQKILNPAFRK
jgi:hypothetical protein